MKTWIMIAFCLVLPRLSWSDVLNLEPSFVCPNKTNFEGVTCCLEDSNQCARAANQELLKAPIERAKLVQAEYKAGGYKFGQVPNCHWNAFAYAKVDEAVTPTMLNEGVLWDWLAENAFEVSASEAQPGDLVLFIFVGTTREDVLEDGRAKWIRVPFEYYAHSAILTGKNQVFQKENAGTQVFSIAGLEQTRIAYEKGYASWRPWDRGQMTLRFIRLKSNQSRAFLGPVS